MSDADVRAFGARGVILSGGPESVTDAQPPKAPEAVFELGVPVLGICYGMQTMAEQLGGRVSGSDHREFGYAQVTVTAPCRLLQRALRSPRRSGPLRARRVDEPRRSSRGACRPDSCRWRASANAPLAAMADETRQLLRRAVSSRGHAHAAGRAHARALRARDLRLRSPLGRRQHHRGCHRARARAGGQRQGAARPVGRRRFVGGRGTAAPGDRRPADLRVRRPRPAARRRRRSGHGHLRASTWA